MRTPSLAHSQPATQIASIAARIVERLKGATVRATRSVSRPALNQRVLYRLSTLSERELGDIGLTRSDVVEAGLPENGDATHFLNARRDGRHRARHGASPF
jgi:uncharacterized protein YjiS (DUF1127 family)